MSKIDGLSFNDRFWNEIEKKYVTEDGCEWDNPGDIYWCHFWGFCGCGVSEHLMDLICNTLQALRPNASSNGLDGIKALGLEPYALITDFLFYWLDKEGYTEHGGSVTSGGWTTPKGEALI